MSSKLTVKDIKDKLEDDTLDLSLCNLDEVPVKGIASVKRFTHLDLSNNVLTLLPKTFATLTQIIKLDLSNNMITEIPENFGELRQLKHLDLYSNKISRLPLSLSELKNLKWLDLKENPLTSAVASIAGPCSNASECQACARNIVSYLENVKQTLNERKISNITAAQEVEKSLTNNKKEAKKKKKNVEKKILENNKTVDKKREQREEKINAIIPPKSVAEKESSNESNELLGSIYTLCRFILYLLLWSGFIILMILILITYCPVYEDSQADGLFKNIETQMGVPIRYYHYQGIRFMEGLILKTKYWTNRTRELIEQTYEEYV